MKTISKGKIQGYEELKKHEHFIYVDGQFEFVAIKINERYCAFLNGSNEFIIARKYTNCLSIGSGTVFEFATFAEAETYAIEKQPIL